MKLKFDLKIEYCWRLNNFKLDFQLPSLFEKNYIYGTYFNGSHDVCLHVCALWLVYKKFLSSTQGKINLNSTLIFCRRTEVFPCWYPAIFTLRMKEEKIFPIRRKIVREYIHFKSLIIWLFTFLNERSITYGGVYMRPDMKSNRNEIKKFCLYDKKILFILLFIAGEMKWISFRRWPEINGPLNKSQSFLITHVKMLSFIWFHFA